MENKKLKVLDFGCGHGYNSFIFSKKYDVTGIDFPDNVAICKSKYPNIDFRMASSSKIDIEDSYFDKIFAIEVLEHVDFLEDTASELHRILKIGGKLTVSVPYHESERFLLTIKSNYFEEIHHVRIFEEGQMEKLMSDKFTLVKKRRTNFMSHLELIYLFLRENKSKSQVSIGSWRDSYFGMFLHALLALFSMDVFKTPLKYFPIWIITLPIGLIIDSIGNIFFPKSIYFEFIKK